MDLGRYRVLRPLGKGGMAEVLEAVAVGAEGFERKVAIKRLLPGYEHDPGLVGMFLDEARIASRLHHANIVSVVDYGVVDGQPFQVLELVDGLDAGKLWSRGKERGEPLPLPLVLHLGTTIAHALHHAHQATDAQGQSLGIVHRDVSPGNILVSWGGDVLLSDFGIAFAKHRSERTRTGVAKGTVTYWAPEQATGGQVDPRSDVFSLAATLHRLLVGRSPLAGENALADLLVGRALPLDSSLPADVAEVLAKALRRDKAERYADAAEFAGALGACMTRRLEEDPRSALRRWLSELRDRPQAKPSAGSLDALLGLEWVVVGEDDGVRTFAAHGTAPATAPLDASDDARVEAPAQTPAASSTMPSAEGAARTPMGGTVVVDTPLQSSAPSQEAPRRRGGAWFGLAVGLLVGGGVAAWAWLSAPEGSTARPSAPSMATNETSAEPPPAESMSMAASSTTAVADEGTTGSGTSVDSGADASTGTAAPTTTTGPSTEGETPEPRPRGRSVSKSRERPPRGPQGPASDEATGTGFLLIGGAGALRAEIFVDGRRHGHAPRRVELSAGRHRVVLRDESGTEIAARDVELRSTHTRSSPFRWVVSG